MTRRLRIAPVPDGPGLQPLLGTWTSEGNVDPWYLDPPAPITPSPDAPIPLVVWACVLGLAALAGSGIAWAGSALYDRLTGGHHG